MKTPLPSKEKTPSTTTSSAPAEDHIPLALKYRPKRFQDLVGQELVAKALQNAVHAGRLHSVYLLAGPRGSGKTSAARILAKAANCSFPEKGEPCLKCPSCVHMEAGRHFDIHEFDAASNRKVEDAEELLRKVPAHPMRSDSKFKFFIVDEVHMMSTTAFNALLKTLEEPPRWVRFILATTEPESVPDTILSRCHRFDLRTVPKLAAARHLGTVAKAEGIALAPALAEGLVRRARGGMRDALQLLDQAVSLCGKTLDGKLLAEALGLSTRGASIRIFRALAAGSVGQVFESLEGALSEGHSSESITEKASETARDILVLKTLGKEMAERISDDPASIGDIVPFVERFTEENLLHMLTQLTELERRLRQAKNDRILLETTFLRLARVKDLLPLSEALERLRRMEETLGEEHGQPGIPAAQGA